MTDLLGALQERYHPLGKPIFTNIHVNLDAFPLYLVSDVPGIESSLFNDQDSMFFYRASSYKKPLLLLNFMNLHGLDKRDVAERYHLNAAQWGELPSTGRFVQDAYGLYGDLGADPLHEWGTGRAVRGRGRDISDRSGPGRADRAAAERGHAPCHGNVRGGSRSHGCRAAV